MIKRNTEKDRDTPTSSPFWCLKSHFAYLTSNLTNKKRETIYPTISPYQLAVMFNKFVSF